ncbi:MAG: hypothetical protein KDA86_11245 [Planctomycetaceae bacterium]|nr:hypothetical protein [Planctomycetaceae bacterium]
MSYAEFLDGVSDEIKRAVSENANSLGFKSKVWECGYLRQLARGRVEQSTKPRLADDVAGCDGLDLFLWSLARGR